MVPNGTCAGSAEGKPHGAGDSEAAIHHPMDHLAQTDLASLTTRVYVDNISANAFKRSFRKW